MTFFFFAKIKNKKNGPPTTDVIMPMGKIIPGTMILLIIDASDKIIPPNTPEAGR